MNIDAAQCRQFRIVTWGYDNYKPCLNFTQTNVFHQIFLGCHMGGCSMNIVHTLQTLERVNIYKCFHRRGVSLEGDPIARSRQVEAKQTTYIYIQIHYILMIIFRQQRRGSSGRQLCLSQVELSHLFCWYYKPLINRVLNICFGRIF